MPKPLRTPVTIENALDQDRRAAVEAVVDTDVATVVVPEENVEQLELQHRGAARVRRYGLAERLLAGPITVRIADRSMITTCIVGVAGTNEAMIGLTVLTYLDLVEDTRTRTLRPRHPDWTLATRGW